MRASTGQGKREACVDDVDVDGLNCEKPVMAQCL